MLKSLDLEYHNLNSEKGLYYGLMQEGRVPRLTTDKAVELAMDHHSPQHRAFGQGELVKHLLTCGRPAEPEAARKEERLFRLMSSIGRSSSCGQSHSHAGSFQELCAGSPLSSRQAVKPASNCPDSKQSLDSPWKNRPVLCL